MNSKHSISRLDIVIKENNLSMSKRSQSDIVATILLILLTISAAIIVVGFVLPSVRDQISKSECFDFSGKIEIVNSEFTCYNSTNKNLLVQIGIKDIDEKKINTMKALMIIVNQDGSSDSFKIINGSSPGRVSMSKGELLVIPRNGEEKTYNITSIDKKPISISVYPVLANEKECAEANYQINEIDYCY